MALRVVPAAGAASAEAPVARMRPAETVTAARTGALGLCRHPLLHDAVALALALASLAWFLGRGIAALDIGEFGDETEKIVGARMIAAGGRL